MAQRHKGERDSEGCGPNLWRFFLYCNRDGLQQGTCRELLAWNQDNQLNRDRARSIAALSRFTA